MKKCRKNNIIICMLFIFSFICVSYPFISNYISSKMAKTEAIAFSAKMKNQSDENFEKMITEAQTYNAGLLDGKIYMSYPFKSPKNKDAAYAVEYNELLNNDNDGLMCFVKIPKIKVNIPVFHGIDDIVLERGAGHLCGSALPVGGKGTHAVITAHTGLVKNKLFTDLVNLEKKDKFFINLGRETLAYEVDNIKVIEPNELVEYINVDLDNDYVTLMTCTPYGINSHRLLVRGHRIPYDENESLDKIAEQNTDSRWFKVYRRLLLVAFTVMGIVFLGMQYILQKKGVRK